ncbi:MAG: ribonuclease D [Wenzhouxiangellaceae bacterium]
MPEYDDSHNTNRLNKAHQACSQALWIRDNVALAAAAVQWLHCPRLGLDTEFIREKTFYPQLALIQISDGHSVWLIDCLEVDNYAPLAAVLDSERCIKVLHSPREDLEVLHLTTSTLPRPLFDTQAAAALCGGSLQLSYGALLQQELAVELSKEQSRSNWLQRPLTPQQIDYACRDVAYLPLLSEQLERQLQTLNRLEWLHEDMRWLLAESQSTIPDDELYQQLPGAARLPQSALTALQALCAWREQQARERDLPRQFVLRNDVVLRLAQAEIHSVDDLAAYKLHPGQIRRHGEGLVALLRQAAQQPAPAAVPLLDPAQQARIKQGQRLVKTKAAELELDPAVLCSRRELERWLKDGVAQPPSRLQGWRLRQLEPGLSNCLHGDRATVEQ